MVRQLSWRFIAKKAIVNRTFRFMVLLRVMLLAKKKGSYLLARILRRWIQRKYLAEISYHADIGLGFQVPHPQGIIIGGNTKIGDFVSLGQHCTLGGNFGRKSETGDRYPVVGDNVRILAGSVVAGPIHIGRNSVVAANSVVTRDVEEETTVSGVPALAVKVRGHKVEQISEKVDRLEGKIRALEESMLRLSKSPIEIQGGGVGPTALGDEPSP